MPGALSLLQTDPNRSLSYHYQIIIIIIIRSLSYFQRGRWLNKEYSLYLTYFGQALLGMQSRTAIQEVARCRASHRLEHAWLANEDYLSDSRYYLSDAQDCLSGARDYLPGTRGYLSGTLDHLSGTQNYLPLTVHYS